LARLPGRLLIWINSRWLLLAAAVPDQEVEHLSLGICPSALEGDRGQYLVAAPIERKPSQQ